MAGKLDGTPLYGLFTGVRPKGYGDFGHFFLLLFFFFVYEKLFFIIMDKTYSAKALHNAFNIGLNLETKQGRS